MNTLLKPKFITILTAVIVLFIILFVFVKSGLFNSYSDIADKYGNFYFKEENGSYKMTKSSLSSYPNKYGVIRDNYYQLSSSFDNENILFDLSYHVRNAKYIDNIRGSITFGDKSYDIDNSFFIVTENKKLINSIYVSADNKCFYIPLNKQKYIDNSTLIRQIDCQSHNEVSYSEHITISSEDNDEIRKRKEYENVENLKGEVKTISESKSEIVKKDVVEVASIYAGSYVEYKHEHGTEDIYNGLKCSIPVVYDEKSQNYTIILKNKTINTNSVKDMRKNMYTLLSNALEDEECPAYSETDSNAVLDINITDNFISLLMYTEYTPFEDDKRAVVVDRKASEVVDNSLKSLFLKQSLAEIIMGAYIAQYCDNMNIDGDDIYEQMIELPDDMLNNLEKTDFMFFYQIYLMSEKDSFFIDKDRIIIYPNFNKQGVFYNKECAIPLDKIDKIIYSNSYFIGKL